MDWSISTLGAAVVVAVLRDVFHTLWHPSGRGSLSRFVMTVVWRLSRRLGSRGRLAALAGPLALVAVVGTWGILVVLGWTLIYWPHLPDSFVFSTGLQPARRSDLLDAVYLSLVTAATLGFGDIVPAAGWLRLATPLQALVGFALLTAAVSWVLQIYPALTRRRVLALRLALLRRADTLDSLRELDSPLPAVLLESLAGGIAQVRMDFTQHAEIYYFRDNDPSASLAATLGHATDLARSALTSRRADVRQAASVLTCALEDLADLLDEQFLHVGGTTTEILDAYAAEHGHALA